MGLYPRHTYTYRFNFLPIGLKRGKSIIHRQTDEINIKDIWSRWVLIGFVVSKSITQILGGDTKYVLDWD